MQADRDIFIDRIRRTDRDTLLSAWFSAFRTRICSSFSAMIRICCAARSVELFSAVSVLEDFFLPLFPVMS